MENNENCCLAKILKVIDILQKESFQECFPEGCDRPFLGSKDCTIFNTRPINLYTRTGNLFRVNYFVNNTLRSSSTFRVENVKDCCATLRILQPTSENENGTVAFSSTNEFVTVNLECFCVLKCLDDITMEI